MKAATASEASSAQTRPVDGVEGRREFSVSDAGNDGHGEGGIGNVIGGDGTVTDIVAASICGMFFGFF